MTSVSMPKNFLWGAATAGHQNDGGDVDSDTTFLENVSPSVFVEPAGIACGTWERWEEDLDLVADMGMNAFRFSIEWARIEPRRGERDADAIARYHALIDGCHARGLTPLATYNHFTAPHWFGCLGSWMADDAAGLFADHSAFVTKEYGDRLGLVVTLNEPNLMSVLAQGIMPPEVWELQNQTLDAASAKAGVPRYRAGNVARLDELEELEDGFAKAHVLARQAIKAERPSLPVGLSVAITDEIALPGGEAHRDKVRAECYDRWLELARDDDFVGVQNYEATRYDANGRVQPSPEAKLNGMGSPIEPLSLKGAVEYAHEVAGVPVLVTEHGLSASDDSQRAEFLPDALAGLDQAIANGVPVIGYCHWTLLDNFEWISAYGPKFGLHEVDRETLERTPKPSARVLAREIADRVNS